jgi:hypothetical protein
MPSLPVRRLDWRPLALIGWGLCVLLAVPRTGWLCDDMWNASLPGYWIYHRRDALSDTLLEIRGWSAAARFNPLIHAWKNFVFWLQPSLPVYKWALVGAVLVNLVAFYYLLRSLGAGADLAALCCLWVPALFQFRTFADALLSFNAMPQLIFLLTTLSLWLLRRHCTGGGRWSLAGSVLLYLAAALTYEVTYAFWVLHLWVIVTARPSPKRAARTLVPFVSIPLLLALLSALVRALAPPLGDYALSPDPQAWAAACCKQFAAALPCSFTAWYPLSPVRHLFAARTFTKGWYVLLLAFGLGWYLTRNLCRQARAGALHPGRWATLGLLLAVLPVPLLCACARYQQDLVLGDGYLPVYVQSYGVALLLAAGIAALACWGRRWAAVAGMLPPASALLCALIAVLHHSANDQVVASLRVPFLSPRREVEEALDAGLLGEVAPRTTLLVDRMAWDTEDLGLYFYCCHTRTRLKSVRTPRRGRRTRQVRRGRRPMMRVRYVDLMTERGYILAGKLHRATVARSGAVVASRLSRVRLAVRRLPGGPDRPFVLHAPCPGHPHAPSTLRKVCVTPNWTIYDIHTPYPLLDGEAIRLEWLPAPAGQ